MNSDRDEMFENAPPEALHSVAGMLSVSALAIHYLLDKPYRTHQFIDYVRNLPSFAGAEDDPSDAELIEDMHEALSMTMGGAERADDYTTIAFANQVAREAANGSNKRKKDTDD